MEYNFGKKKKKIIVDDKQNIVDDNKIDNNLYYPYEFLLKRITDKTNFKINNKIKINPPKIYKFGGKKIIYENYSETCEKIGRSKEHIMSFFLTELMCSCSIDQKNRLVISGIFDRTKIESLLIKYVNQYVKCNQCKSANTMMTKENKIEYLKCMDCCAKHSLSNKKIDI